jgi:hypothetical protein
LGPHGACESLRTRRTLRADSAGGALRSLWTLQPYWAGVALGALRTGRPLWPLGPNRSDRTCCSGRSLGSLRPDRPLRPRGPLGTLWPHRPLGSWNELNVRDGHLEGLYPLGECHILGREKLVLGCQELDLLVEQLDLAGDTTRSLCPRQSGTTEQGNDRERGGPRGVGARHHDDVPAFAIAGPWVRCGVGYLAASTRVHF